MKEEFESLEISVVLFDSTDIIANGSWSGAGGDDEGIH